MLNPLQDSLAGAPLAAMSVTREGVLSAPFRCTYSREGVEAAWVQASGDLDLAGAPELDAALRNALASARLVVLDLGELTFIDLVGVRTIIDASVRAVCDGRRLMVAFAPAHVERTFMLTGTAEAIEMLDLDTTGASAGPRPHLVKSASAA